MKSDPTISGTTRTQTINERIDPKITGLRASVYVHVDYDDNFRVTSIRLSEKAKDGFGLDPVFHAIGDRLTQIIDELNKTNEQIPGD